MRHDLVLRPPRISDVTRPENSHGRRVVDRFVQRFGRSPQLLVRAPGRLCLLGAHVDTAQGWVLPGAIDRAIWLAASLATDRSGSLVACDLTDESGLDPARLAPPRHQRPGDPLRWTDYPQGVAWTLGNSGVGPLPPLDVVFGGDIPRGAGLSSSAAVEVAFLLAWNALAGLRLDRRSLAELATRVEREYVGVRSGVMDPFASLFGQSDHLLWLDCRSLDSRPVPLPTTVSVVVVDSGTRRELAASEFNARRTESAAALQRVRELYPSVETLRDLSVADLPDLLPQLPSPLDRRVQHVVEECARVQQGVEALERGEVETFGQLLRASHESSRDLFECSLPRLDAMAAAAWATEGCLGARFMGGGFGGCVAALVEVGSEPATAEAMLDVVGEVVPPPLVCRFADGAAIVDTVEPGNQPPAEGQRTC